MRILMALIGALIVVLAVWACWGKECVASHTEIAFIPMWNNGTSVTFMPMVQTVCDATAPVKS